jgi:UDP-glucuronate decarboxylase
MNKILITGGAGNVAGNLASSLVETGNYYVVIVDNLSTGNISNLPSKNYDNWKFIKADVNLFEEISPIVVSYKFDYVFHYAAVVGVKRTTDNPIKVLNDVDGIRNILNLCKSTGVKRVFFSSSSEVYGEPVELPQHEERTPLNSRLPYAIVKNIGESYLKSYFQEYGLEYTVFRFFNTYGPKQSEDFVIPRFLKAALNGNDITIYGDGSQTRTFCYVKDNFEVTKSILENGLGINETINIGHDLEISVLQLAKFIIGHTKSNSKIIHLPALLEGDMTRRQPDITRMKQILGRELINLETGLNYLIDKYKIDGVF